MDKVMRRIARAVLVGTPLTWPLMGQFLALINGTAATAIGVATTVLRQVAASPIRVGRGEVRAALVAGVAGADGCASAARLAYEALWLALAWAPHLRARVSAFGRAPREARGDPVR